MVIRGSTRGNGQQLAKYLLFQGENENIQILDVNGRIDPHDRHLHEALLSMSLTSELTTRSDKGLYHAQINPGYGDDSRMTGDNWLQAADMLGRELGLEEQRRVVVLHTKKGRTHAHVVWERYDMEKGKMISDSFSRLAQDRARQEMEKVFEHKATPQRNQKRPEMKEYLSSLWQKIKTGTGFIKEAQKQGYIIAAGIQRRPFMVVDETGRSFDLVRQLDGIKTKEVRERLKGEKLIAEKDAIASVRKQQKFSENAKLENAVTTDKAGQTNRNNQLASLFAEDRQDLTGKGATKENEKISAAAVKNRQVAHAFCSVKDDILLSPLSEEEKYKNIAEQFAVNSNETVSYETEKEQKRQKILNQLKQTNDRQNSQGRGREPD